jgi:alpha-glucoside transport system permease protein
MHIETAHGLRLEVAGRELAGWQPDPGRAHAWGRYLLGLPALLMLAFLLIPMIWTAVSALAAPTPIVGNFADILTDSRALAAGWHSVLWVGIALVLIAIGYGIALVSQVIRGARLLLTVLILPFGVAALVSGAVFRMIFDPNPERGMASALFGNGVVWLGPDLVWLVLGSAFAWTWLGFIVVLFRAGLDTSGSRRPGPVTTIIVLTVLIAAIRVFDMVLIVAPGSTQDSVDVVGLHWWRMTSGSVPDTGHPAALAVLLFIVVATIALVGMRSGGKRAVTSATKLSGNAVTIPPERKRSGLDADEPRTTATPRGHRAWGTALSIALAAFWLLPVVVLLATALHDPAAAGSAGWWHPEGLGLGSLAALVKSWLWPALLGNVLVAVLATALVVAIATPAAYLLVWGGLPRWCSGGLTKLLVVLAVAPVQLYAAPVSDAIAALGLTGSRAPLALIHAAAGLPFATLVLRTAFLAAPIRNPIEQRPALDAMWRRGRYRPALIAVIVLEFILVWNDFIVGFLISGPGPPFTLLLWGEARQFGASAGTVAAASVAVAVIPVAVLLATWPRVVAGLTGGVTR